MHFNTIQNEDKNTEKTGRNPEQVGIQNVNICFTHA